MSGYLNNFFRNILSSPPKAGFFVTMNSKLIVLVSTEITNQQLAITAMQLVSGYSVLAANSLLPSFEVVRKHPHDIQMKKQQLKKQAVLFSEVENGGLWGICYAEKNEKFKRYKVSQATQSPEKLTSPQ